MFQQLLRHWAAQLGQMKRDLKRELDAEYEELARDAVEGGLEFGRDMGGVAAHVAGLGSIRSRGNTITWDARSKKRGATLGSEFGGGKHGPGNPTPAGGHTTQFAPHRGQSGYMVYRFLREHSNQSDKRYDAALDRSARRAFPD